MTDELYPDDQCDPAGLRADLDRFMQSKDPRKARDIVRENLSLMGPMVANFLSEAAKRTRQLGDEKLAESCEYWLGLLRKFREFGVEEGYLEVAIDELCRARTPEDHRRVLLAYPELKTDAAAAYMKRRFHESSEVSDVSTWSKYQFGMQITHAELKDRIDSLYAEQANPTEAVNAFVHEFIQQSDVTGGRNLLEARPDLLQFPLSLLVGAMFQPYIERARAMNDLVTLRELLLRQALFGRCQSVGLVQAFEELAEGVKWSELCQTR